MRRVLTLCALAAIAGASAGDGGAGCCEAEVRAAPQWLPGGAKLVYEMRVASTGFVVTAAPGGAAETTLLRDAAGPALSPDGSRLAALKLGTRVEVIVARADGTGVRALGPAAQVAPAWAPDGHRLAYTTAGGDLRIVDVDAGSGTTLGRGGTVAWAPDGTQLVVATGAPSTLTVVALGGSRVELGRGADAQWSPDGRWIAFDRGDGVWLVRPDGSEAHVLRMHTRDPAWAPDSARIAAVLTDRGQLAGGDFPTTLGDVGELGIVAVDGNARPLGVLAADQRPAWSRDGARIAFARSNGNGHGIHVVAASGAGLAVAGAGGCVPSAPPRLVGCTSFGGYSVPQAFARAPLSLAVANGGARRADPPSLRIAVHDARGFRVRTARVRVTAYGATPRPAVARTSYVGTAFVALVRSGKLPRTLRVVVTVGSSRLVLRCRDLRFARSRGC
jgi:hypothetical protein